MTSEKKQILIESILGGESAIANFSSNGQYHSGQGINPDSALSGKYTPSGFIIPTFVSSVGAFSTYPAWIETTPKDTNYYVYDVGGSVYTSGGSSVTGLTDLNDGGTARGNGFAYYDNYIYAARSTTVARYGPLDGTAAWTDDYWVATLGKTALSDTTYKSPSNYSITTLNHAMLRHTDGNLYFADVVGGQGVLHKISTTKTTVEGDTDSGSEYAVIDFPYGMYPTALASYGDMIAVALYEGTSVSQQKARLILWDPTNRTTYETITGPEFPDQYITALLNTNGILYTFSGALDGGVGLRVCRYLGGRSFEQVAYIDHATLPIAGGVIGNLNRVAICSSSYRTGSQRAAIFSIGSRISGVSSVITNTISAPAQIAFVTSLYSSGSGLSGQGFIFGGSEDGSVSMRLYKQATPQTIGGHTTNSYFISETVRVGKRFKVTKIILNLTSPIDSSDNFSIVPYVNVDNSKTQYILNPINYSAIGTKTHVVISPGDASGTDNFNIQFDFSGTLNQTGFGNGISLPITIEYETYDE